ncbi:unnamed protein product [Cuscuta epithymum]|uniref:Uncharacterized protein n=1 Tax=Cuscuta epithymum TaxID=186058 RepID=A0AAV0FQ58_9ASTE|nr:unnamed protein product [Cuscuta epithymum]
MGVIIVVVTVTEQHDLVVAEEKVVGDGDGGGALRDVDQPVLAMNQGAVVDPHHARHVYGYSVAVRRGHLLRQLLAHLHPVVFRRGLAVVDEEVVDDDVGDREECDAAHAGDVHVRAAAVDGLVTVDEELVPELDFHVGRECDPEFFLSSHPVPESARFWISGVGVVRRVFDHIDLSAFPARRIFPEPNAALRQLLPVVLPAHVGSSPAVVDRVSGLVQR